MSILEQILSHKREEVARAKERVPPAVLEKEALARAAQPAERPRFADALAGSGGVRIIAEIKKASPSKGVIREDFDPVELARIYEAEGAAAISVLTDQRFFQGSLDHLDAVRRSVTLPLLRKEFIIDPYQVLEAKVHGADGILLIVAALERQELAALLRMAGELGLDALVEVHTEEELEVALDAGAALIGINNRDLNTFQTSLETTERLAARIPTGIVIVSESGISTPQDLQYLESLGVHAALIGEALTRERDVAAKLRALTGRKERVS